MNDYAKVGMAVLCSHQTPLFDYRFSAIWISAVNAFATPEVCLRATGVGLPSWKRENWRRAFE